MALPKRVQERLVGGLKRMVPIVLQQKARDVSEADTVTLVKDLMADVFGYDKYAELTGEHAIRGTFCDLAVKVEGKIPLLIEVKAAASALDDRHVKQAIDYASNQGVEWVLLTNASVWRLYQVVFAKPIDKRLLCEIDLTTLDPRKEQDLERAFLLTKEGFTKGAHLELRDRQDATNRYLLTALLQHNDAVISTMRRELRRIVGVLVEDEDLIRVLREEVLKRDALEGPEAEAAVRRVERAEAKASKPKAVKDDLAAAVVEAALESPANTMGVVNTGEGSKHDE